MGQMNRSVLRAISLLRVFQCEDEWISASEISRRASLPFASTYRLLQTLEQTGAVDKGEGGSYRLGYLIASLCQNVNVDDCLHRASRDLIVGLSDRLNVSVFLGRLEGRMVTLIGRAFAPTSRYKFVPVGSRFSAHSFALGRVLLADVSEENLERILKEDGSSPSQGAMRKSELAAELALIRREGFAVERNQAYPGLGTVAVPLRDHDGRVFAALSASDEPQDMMPSRIAFLRNELLSLEPLLRGRILPGASARRVRDLNGSAVKRAKNDGLLTAHPPAQIKLLKRVASS